MAARNAASGLPEAVGAASRVWRAATIDGQARSWGSVGVPKRETNQAATAGWKRLSGIEAPDREGRRAVIRGDPRHLAKPNTAMATPHSRRRGRRVPGTSPSLPRKRGGARRVPLLYALQAPTPGLPLVRHSVPAAGPAPRPRRRAALSGHRACSNSLGSAVVGSVRRDLDRMGGNGKTFTRASTGIPGLDYALDGGLPVNRLYLVQGEPGAGKTTLAMQFLLAGAARGEPALYATLSETEEELRDVAVSHGWRLDGVAICDLQSTQAEARNGAEYALFHPSEVELAETTRSLLDTVDRLRPARLVLDSLSEMRLLARDSLRYRRQILSVKQYLASRNCTVLLLDYGLDGAGDFQLQSLTHGLITLEHLAPGYRGQRPPLRS